MKPTPTPHPDRSAQRPEQARGRRRILRRLSITLLIVGGLVALNLAAYAVYLDVTVLPKFEGRRWSLPSHVYARPLELYSGLHLQPDLLEQELQALAYRRVRDPDAPGLYSRAGDTFRIVTRGFNFSDGPEVSHSVHAVFRGGVLARLYERSGRRRNLTRLVRLEPLRIGGMYPLEREDRIPVQLKEVPELLVDALLAVEDRGFYAHKGISLRGVARALTANLRVGTVSQGGSTLTQQLAKNYFLSGERTLWRKVQEALIAMLLELHYSKEEILEAYLNEVYLGQDGDRAIHGFGLASHFFFRQDLEELRPSQLVLLIALVRGPSLYNPRRHSDRAAERRNRILDLLVAQEVMDEDAARQAQLEPLGVAPSPPRTMTAYPAFLELIRRQLHREYGWETLTSEGLRIFTTLDPIVQYVTETALPERLTRLEDLRELPAGTLEGAAVVTNPDSGEVLALVGGRHTKLEGFNRALDAVRPIGSLVKPAVYLTALESGQYTLATLLDDTPLQVKQTGGETWAPENYDREAHGQVLLQTALAYSHNLATARLGMALGLDSVLSTLRTLGVERQVPAYPSVLLGAVSLSPFEVTQMYQTLAAGGFRTPLRAIREVLTAEGMASVRFPIEVEQVVRPETAYLLTVAMQEVVRSGTGSHVAQLLSPELNPAGKTGTTDEFRDSWFAGFTGDYLAVTWVGRDDYQQTGLTGADGAMRVWVDILRPLQSRPLELVPPTGIVYAAVDDLGRQIDYGCTYAVTLPFERGSVPEDLGSCMDPYDNIFEARTPTRSLSTWFKELTR